MKYTKFGKISAVTLMAFVLMLIVPGIALGSGPIQSGDVRNDKTIIINVDEERADNVIVVHTDAGDDVAIILKFGDERDDLVIIVEVDDGCRVHFLCHALPHGANRPYCCCQTTPQGGNG